MKALADKKLRTARLRILNGERAGQTIELSGAAVTLGRHPNCDIRVTDDTVSRRHARIFARGEGYVLEDLGSRNGTFVNGRQISGQARLSNHDRIHIFNTLVEFLDNEEEDHAEEACAQTVTFDEHVVQATPSRRLFETTAEIDVTSPEVMPADIGTDATLQAVLQITRYLRSLLEPDEILSRIVECVTHIFPFFSRSYLLRYDAVTGQLVPVVIKSSDAELNGPGTLRPISQALAREVLARGKAVLSVGPPADDSDAAMGSVLEASPRSFMCAPLAGPSLKAAGILYIETRDELSRFGHGDLEVFACVAILAGQALEQATWFGARYRAVVDNAVDGIITVRDDGTIESVNAAVAKLFGYSEEELLGENVILLMTDEDRRKYEAAPESILESGRGDFIGVGREVLARRKDGTAFPIYLSIGEFELGGRHYLTGIVHDISERHRAEAELRRVNETLEQQVRDRTEYIRLLQDVAVIANQSESANQAFQTALERVLPFRPWDLAHVVLRSPAAPGQFADANIWIAERPTRFKRLISAGASVAYQPGQGIVGGAIDRARPVWTTDVGSQADSPIAAAAALCGLKTAVACPVLIGTEVVAILEFFSTSSDPPDDVFLEMMRHVATPLGRVIERERFQKQLVDAVWTQHRRFGQELHDTLGQALTGIGMYGDSLAKRLTARGEPESGSMSELVGMIQQAKGEVRQLSKGLYPVDVDAQGLLSALEELATATQQRSRIECTFRGDRDIQIRDNELATHLFRIAQEAVHNAMKHGDAKKISISLTRPRGRVSLVVRDDGTGLPVDLPATGLGMKIMQYRANAIGAQLSFDSSGKAGTVVRCILKREENHAHSGRA